jgi:hypothetical protein
MNRLNLRNNWLKLKNAGKLPINLEESIEILVNTRISTGDAHKSSRTLLRRWCGWRGWLGKICQQRRSTDKAGRSPRGQPQICRSLNPEKLKDCRCMYSCTRFLWSTPKINKHAWRPQPRIGGPRFSHLKTSRPTLTLNPGLVYYALEFKSLTLRFHGFV